MFLLEYARSKSLLRVTRKYRDHLLRDDWATIESFINKVNRAAGPLDSVFQNLPVRIESGKRRQ
jgi:hypothetical protein